MFLQNDKIVKFTKNYDKLPEVLTKVARSKNAHLDLGNVQEEAPSA